MPKRILVRDDRTDRTFEWRPSGNETAADLLILIAEAEGSPLDGLMGKLELVDGLNGQPIAPGTTADTLRGDRVTARTGFVCDAEAQLAILREQYGGRFDFHRLGESASFLLDFGFGGLIERNGTNERLVVVSGHHQALMYLPSDFPRQRPTVTWLTAIFHPNLQAQCQVWPPGLVWPEPEREQAPSVTALVGALTETLVGMRADTGRLSGLLGRPANSVGNKRASSWFRKYREEIATFGESQLFCAPSLGGEFPLDLPDADWRLTGHVTGGEPLIFLSAAAAKAVRSRTFGSGWLVGTRNSRQGTDWIYVDRVLPADFRRGRPASAVGALHGTEDGQAIEMGDARSLYVGLSPDGTAVSLRYGERDLSGHFVGPLGPSDTEGSLLPKIRVETEQPLIAEGEQSEPGTMSAAKTGSGELVAIESTEGECPYCSGPLTGHEEWHNCPGCGVPAHGGCRERLSGCPNAACQQSPINSGQH
jgi:hypothetical protein